MPLLDRTLPEMPLKRRSIRLKDYDYAQPGAYFVTICTHERRCLWGSVHAGKVSLNGLGQIVVKCRKDIPAHFPQVCVDIYCVMRNHLHGILLFSDLGKGTTCRALTAGAETIRGDTPRDAIADAERFSQPVAASLPTVIRSFKAAVTKHIRRITRIRDLQVWQRGYFERVIRDERELELAREYIVNNPLRWEEDAENPAINAGGVRGTRHDEPG